MYAYSKTGGYLGENKELTHLFCMRKQKNEKTVEAVFRMNVESYQVFFRLKEHGSSSLSL